jgi:ABC-type Na+ transport system ATPase subunit NatA
MFIDGNQITKHVVEVVMKEEKIIKELAGIYERFATAENLGNVREMNELEKEGNELNHRLNHFIAEKAIVMTIYVDKNHGFRCN